MGAPITLVTPEVTKRKSTKFQKTLEGSGGLTDENDAQTSRAGTRGGVSLTLLCRAARLGAARFISTKEGGK